MKIIQITRNNFFVVVKGKNEAQKNYDQKNGSKSSSKRPLENTWPSHIPYTRYLFNLRKKLKGFKLQINIFVDYYIYTILIKRFSSPFLNACAHVYIYIQMYNYF